MLFFEHKGINQYLVCKSCTVYVQVIWPKTSARCTRKTFFTIIRRNTSLLHFKLCTLKTQGSTKLQTMNVDNFTRFIKISLLLNIKLCTINAKVQKVPIVGMVRYNTNAAKYFIYLLEHCERVTFHFYTY